MISYKTLKYYAKYLKFGASLKFLETQIKFRNKVPVIKYARSWLTQVMSFYTLIVDIFLLVLIGAELRYLDFPIIDIILGLCVMVALVLGIFSHVLYFKSSAKIRLYLQALVDVNDHLCKFGSTRKIHLRQYGNRFFQVVCI